MKKLFLGKSFVLLTTTLFLVGGFFVATPAFAVPPPPNPVTITTATGGTNISADKAANGNSSQYTVLGNMVLAEVTGGKGSIADTGGINKTFILSAPSGWSFQSGIGSVSFTAGKDIQSASITITSNDATVTLNVSGTNSSDTLTISGLSVQATNAGSVPSAGNILRISSNPGTETIIGVTNDSTNFGSLSQTQASQTITVNTNAPASATYGDTFGVAATASSTLPVAITTTGGCSGGGSDSATITMTSGTTSCVVHYNQAGNATYNAAPEVTETTTTQLATLTISGMIADSQIYDGSNIVQTISNAGTLVGVIPGDDVTQNMATGTYTFADADVGAGKTVTTTGITLTGADAGNYTLTQPTTTADILVRPITVTADALSKTYGDPDPVVLTYGITGTLVGADTFSGALSRDGGEDVGTYAVNQNTLALSSNYNLIFTPGILFTISPKAVLSVTADDLSITYGDPEPAFTFIYSGWKNGDDEGDLDTLPTCSVSGSHLDAGSYPIFCSGGVDNNYDFSYYSATLVVITKTYKTGDAQSKIYGTADPALTYTSDPLVGTDTLSGALTRDVGENVGTYAINQGTVDNANNPNYAITYVGANLTITMADQTITFGALPAKIVTDPDFAVSASSTSGLTVVFDSTTLPVCTVSGTMVHLVSAGTCTINASQAGDSNYNAATDVPQSFTVSLIPPDTTPDAFNFTDRTEVTLNTIIESDEVTISGINAATAISVTGGEYSINGGAYTAVAGTVSVGDTVKVRNTSSTLNSTAVDTTLTIGGVSGTFTSTTVAAPRSGGGGGQFIGQVLGASTGPGEVLGAAKFIFTLFLKRGSRGNEVTELQKFLNAAPYNKGLVVDGKFGPLTEAAVKAFQTINPPLKTDGIVGPLTRAVLNR